MEQVARPGLIPEPEGRECHKQNLGGEGMGDGTEYLLSFQG